MKRLTTKGLWRLALTAAIHDKRAGKLRTIATTFAIASIAFVEWGAIASVQGEPTGVRSATKARDIGGFALGMDIRDAKKLSPLTRIAWDDYQTKKDGIDYDFGLTKLGHIYRVDSSQPLGKFAVDDVFLRSLESKLTAKYGKPTEGSAGAYNWSLIEPVKRTGGETLPFETNWTSANVESGPDGVTLNIKMIDFRIMWRDDAQVNRGPRDKASATIKL
ncbi:hypothetical protein [Sphingomonas pruni]|uniref:hypothetical protein n=1 Tax=Sphingomonas pruni TaxID=40683 RepID=UPI001470E54D|nr:hypothetical protein [Sphingomonas pruni]